MIQYSLNIRDAKTHQFEVSLTLNQPVAKQRLTLPVWIPGSYLVREFSKHLSALTAKQGGRPIKVIQLDKCSWEVDSKANDEPLEVSWRVYAFDTSVRTAYLDQRRGFVNGTSLFLCPVGFESESIQLELLIEDKQLNNWAYACALPELENKQNQKPHLITTLQASSYDELVDSPIEFGNFWKGTFTAAGALHEFVVAGAPIGFDGERLLEESKKICEEVIAFWHGVSKALPYQRYLFMLNAVDDSYGGLEHNTSTALICKREDLPRKGESTKVVDRRVGYQNLLTLICHEFFHVWNVKRMRPTELKTYDYAQENYTELLWFFEGMTSYYEYILVYRAGLLTKQQVLDWISKDLAAVERMPGRKVQTVAEASFDAWIKFYRIDENTINSTVSYYSKGAMIALCLDLTLRSEGNGTLDNLLQLLWQSSNGGPISEDDIQLALKQVGKRTYKKELQAWVHSVAELPVEKLLKIAGVITKRKPATIAQKLGLVVNKTSSGLFVKSVLLGSAAEQAGVAAGDELIAINDWRIKELDQWAVYVPNGASAELLVARDAQIMSLTLLADEQVKGTVQLELDETIKQTQLQPLLKQWLK